MRGELLESLQDHLQRGRLQLHPPDVHEAARQEVQRTSGSNGLRSAGPRTEGCLQDLVRVRLQHNFCSQYWCGSW